VVHPRDIGVVIPLGAVKTVVGRAPTGCCARRIDQGTVSRAHLEIRWDRSAGAHLARDLGSHNGSSLNGSQLPPQQDFALDSGAVLRLGNVLLVYEDGPGIVAGDPPEVSREALPGESPSIREMRTLIARVAVDPSPVLLLGETGTGKEYVAREVHRLSGREGPFMALNCAALSPQLVESQLFGHERGAFTGATRAEEGLFRAAARGTVFLDEIGELPLELQPKLLRVLQEGEVRPVGATSVHEVDIRVVAATNQDLPSQVDSGDFRRDLYARLALWEVPVPSLVERRGDLLSWVDRLYEVWCEKRSMSDSPDLEFTFEAAEALLLHGWPDNLRGLDKLVHRLATRPDTSVPVEPGDLEPVVRPPQPETSSEEPEKPRKKTKKPAPSREELEAAMDQYDGSVRAVAKHFGRDRRQIYRWLKNYGFR